MTDDDQVVTRGFLRTELEAFRTEFRAELRAELDRRFAEVPTRAELDQRFATFRTEIQADIAQAVNGSAEALRAEIQGDIAQAVQTMGEMFRAEMKAVLEPYNGTPERLAKLEAEKLPERVAKLEARQPTAPKTRRRSATRKRR